MESLQTRGTARLRPCRRASLTAVLAVCIGSTATGQIDPTSPTTTWTTIFYPNGNVPDPINDQQTGSAESDIIGNISNPAFYMKYNDGGVSGPTNGYVGFRLRVAADVNPPGFKGAAFVGVDANLDGRLDLFIGVNNQGSGNQIGLWKPGAGLNLSPNTTTIISPASLTYTEAAGNYHFGAVNATIDPKATTVDLDGAGSTDQLLSFVVPFPDIVAQLAALGINGFTRDTPMRLVAATATQDNSLNEDVCGVAGGVNSSSSWEQIGGISLPYTFGGSSPVPEPPSGGLALVGACLALVYWWRREPQD